MDHILPVEHGGTDAWTNLAAMHGAKRPGCPGNYSKGTKTNTTKTTKPKRTRPHSGNDTTPKALFQSGNPSPYPGGYAYASSNPVRREQRNDSTQESSS